MCFNRRRGVFRHWHGLMQCCNRRHGFHFRELGYWFCCNNWSERYRRRGAWQRCLGRGVAVVASIVIGAICVDAFGAFRALDTFHAFTVAAIAVASATAAAAARLVATCFDFDFFAVRTDGGNHLRCNEHLDVTYRAGAARHWRQRQADLFFTVRVSCDRRAVIGTLAWRTRGALRALAAFRTLGALRTLGARGA